MERRLDKGLGVRWGGGVGNARPGRADWIAGMGCDRGADSRGLTRGREDDAEGLASDDAGSESARSASDLG